MAWSAPDGQFSFVAAGVILEHFPSGTERFEEGSAFCSQVREQTISTSKGEAGELPLILGGFAFDSAPLTEEWSNWPVGWLFVPRLCVVSRGDQTEVVLHHLGGQEEEALRTLSETEEQIRSWAKSVEESKIVGHTAQAEHSPLSDPVIWNDGVLAVLNQIEDGALDKVVLAHKAVIQAPRGAAFDPILSIRQLRKNHPGSTPFYLSRPGHGAFLGASPETLVERTGEIARVTALAGTRYGPKAAQHLPEAVTNLAASDKDRREHRLVVDAIINALTPWSDRIDAPREPEVRPFQHLLHLQTPIQAHLNGAVQLCTLLGALHPTPAVGGVPHERSVQWIRDNEAIERGWYAGSVGWLTPKGDGRFVLAIRSALVTEDEAVAYAGAGIVDGSTPEKEWNEVQMKLKTAINALQCVPAKSEVRS